MDKASLITRAASGPCLNTCNVRILHLRTGSLSMIDRSSSVPSGVFPDGLTRLLLDLITEKVIMGRLAGWLNKGGLASIRIPFCYVIEWKYM